MITVSQKTVQLTQSVLRRNYGVSAVLLNKVSDPIQQLFVDKLREYAQKSKGKTFYEASPQIEKDYKDEIAKAERTYGGGKGVDMSKFPEFTFAEPKIDPINAVESK